MARSSAAQRSAEYHALFLLKSDALAWAREQELEADRTLHIPVTKNGYARTIPLSDRALAILQALIDSRTLEAERILAAKVAGKES